MSRRSTRPCERLLTLFQAVNEYFQTGAVSAVAWRKVLDRCGCGNSRHFDFRAKTERDIAMRELVKAMRDVLHAIVDAVERGGAHVSLKMPVEESIEVRSPFRTPPAEDSPEHRENRRKYKPYILDVFEPTIEGVVSRCFKEVLQNKDAS